MTCAEKIRGQEMSLSLDILRDLHQSPVIRQTRIWTISVNVDLLVEITTHFPLHLIYLPWGERCLSNNCPRIGVIADFEAIMNADIVNLCPDDPCAVGKRALSHWKRTRAAEVTAE